MPWGEWWPIRAAGMRAEHEEQRQGFVEAAFIGWQVNGTEEKFGKYLQSLGLSQGDEEAPRPNAIDAHRAMSEGLHIMERDRKRRQGSG